MLSVAVKLDRVAVSFTVRILESCLKCPGQPQIYRQIDQMKSAAPADSRRLIRRAVIDDHVIEDGIFLLKPRHDTLNIERLVIRRYDHQHLVHGQPPPCRFFAL